ncbi:MAG: DeoR/GlpR family DNA-binding transcription regulator [Gemmataceae bacterium]
MLVEERRQKVLELVTQHGFLSLPDLVKLLKVSDSTVRRDLDYLDEKQLLKRTHGGAICTGDGIQLPALEERLTSQLAEKRLIAEKAASRIQDGDTVLLDGGTTTLEVAKLLVNRSLQIVTNSLPIANLFANNPKTDLVMLGGYVYPKTGVALGPVTVRMMEDINVHQTILSISGINVKGFFNSNMLLVETERQMMRCAQEVVVVADHTKVGRQALAFLCDFGSVDMLIVDDQLTPEQRQLLDQTDTKVILAGNTNRNGEDFSS